MKSIILSFCFLLFISLSAKAFDGEIRWGLKGGLSFGYFNSSIGPWQDSNALSATGNSAPFDIASRIGICGGVVLNYALGDVVGVYTELLYSPKGSAFERENPNVIEVTESGSERPQTDRIRYALDYIELPMGVSIRPLRRFSLKLGIAPAFNVSSRLKSNYWEEDGDNDLVNKPPFNGIPGTPVKEETRRIKFDYARRVICSASFELNYNIKRGYFFLNFSQSVLDVYNIEKMNGYNMNTLNAVVSTGFTFLFPE